MILSIDITSAEAKRIKSLTGERTAAEALAALATMAASGRIGRVSMPNAKTRRILRADARDEKAGKIGPTFKTGKALVEWLEKH